MRRVKGELKSITGPLKTIAKGVAVLAGAFAAAAVAAAAFTYKMVKIGEEASTQDARLRNIIKQMGLFGDEATKVSDRLSKFAEAQARMAGVDNAGIKQAQAKLATFSELAVTADEVGGAFDRATMAAVDLAEAGFGTAEANAVQLGKVLQDPIKGITALGRAGVSFTDEERKKIAVLVESNKMLEAQEIVLAAIEKQVGGTAAATANATEKLSEMRKQLINAFAKPVADSFASLTVNAEKTFLQLEKRFAEAGQIFGNALERAVAGDASRFVAIGKMIGELVIDGMKAAVSASGWSMSEALLRGVGKTGEITPDWLNLGLWGKVGKWAEGSADDAARFRGQGIETKISEGIENLNKNIEEMRRQNKEDAVYKAGIRAGGTDRITDPAQVDRFFKELVEQGKITNRYLEEEKQDRNSL